MQVLEDIPLLPHTEQLHYKESQVYLTRFRQYLSRALALVKQHVVSTLRLTTSSVLPKPVSTSYVHICKRGTNVLNPWCSMFILMLKHNLQGAVAVLSENSYAQFYGKFRSSAPKIKVRITCSVTVQYITTLINPRHACAPRVTVVGLSVSLCVCVDVYSDTTATRRPSSNAIGLGTMQA